ncbi:hypothetical protein O6H91_10G106100 [Diphasiastrum complanatum]|uniref:Uncharacterized protein n=1 Tax=Diphasiastrum complanatum TaxID=34168 RepID=A0ACC2CKC7_DIPCM|nr:hypothetical protein O6H91_10G106100 [Diphasiastrum complanatum]
MVTLQAFSPALPSMAHHSISSSCSSSINPGCMEKFSCSSQRSGRSCSTAPLCTTTTIVCRFGRRTVEEESCSSRRDIVKGVVGVVITATTLVMDGFAQAVSTSRRALRYEQIPESEYKTLPNGLKYYDLKVGTGATAVKGSRVAVYMQLPNPNFYR